MKLLVTPNGGAVVGVYDDRLLGLMDRLGPTKVTRASNVEWEKKSRQWVAEDVKTKKVLATGATRAEALQKEHDKIEAGLEAYA